MVNKVLFCLYPPTQSSLYVPVAKLTRFMYSTFTFHPISSSLIVILPLDDHKVTADVHQIM